MTEAEDYPSQRCLKSEPFQGQSKAGSNKRRQHCLPMQSCAFAKQMLSHNIKCRAETVGMCRMQSVLLMGREEGVGAVERGRGSRRALGRARHRSQHECRQKPT